MASCIGALSFPATAYHVLFPLELIASLDESESVMQRSVDTAHLDSLCQQLLLNLDQLCDSTNTHVHAYLTAVS